MQPVPLNIRISYLLSFGVALGMVPATAEASEALPGASRVLNGETVPECGFAPVAYLGNCTGTLVHPEIVLHAQHCGKPRKISLTHGGGGGKKLDVEYCKTYPGAWDTSKDFAFCKLKTPVTDIPPIPVAFGCETEALVAGAEIVHCGFGANGGSGAGNKGFGSKRWGANTVGKLRKKGEFTTINTSPSKIVSCAGDSGGPLLMRLKDKTWRVVGVASTIEGGGCNGSRSYNSYAFTAPGVAWVEKESGVDITPCFDPDGTWAPTKDCGKFYMGDHEGHGTWADGCEGTPVSGFSSTCGDPFGDDGKESGDGEGEGDGDSEGSEKGSEGEPSPDESQSGDSEPSQGEGSEPDPSADEDDSQVSEEDPTSEATEESEAGSEVDSEKTDAKSSAGEDGDEKRGGCSVQALGQSAPMVLGLLCLGLWVRRR